MEVRERILGAVGALFYAEGITASGVDRAAAAAGVSKRTLYKHFPSKEALVAACLDACDTPVRRAFTDAAEAVTDDPRGRLLALFAVLGEWLTRPGFRGCPFVNAAAELADPAQPAREAARRHKAALRAWIRDHAAAADLADPDGLSWQLMALFDGAIAQRLVHGADAPVAPVRAAAAALVGAVAR